MASISRTLWVALDCGDTTTRPGKADRIPATATACVDDMHTSGTFAEFEGELFRSQGKSALLVKAYTRTRESDRCLASASRVFESSRPDSRPRQGGCTSDEHSPAAETEIAQPGSEVSRVAAGELCLCPNPAPLCGEGPISGAEQLPTVEPVREILDRHPMRHRTDGSRSVWLSTVEMIDIQPP